MIRKILTTISAAVLATGLALPADAQQLAKDVFGSFAAANQGPASPIGGYARGCASGNVQLPETGPSWQAMRLSRNRNWGQPELVDFLIGLSRAAQQVGWQGIYVGDMSQPRGGPMTSGHASHQLGLDADIWMLPPSSLSLTRAQRENLSSQSVVARNGIEPSGLWSPQHMAIIRAAARDPRVQRIFVDPVAKWAMCQTETGDRSYLRKIQVVNNHDYHFHVRLRCPAGNRACDGQAEVPAGDHCGAAADMIRDRIDPSRVKPVPADPNYRHPRSFTMADLPNQCQSVAASR
ncbi:MAG: penicillin-insensitive murein endopeptidase [Paracoccus sp. (in: a-proteobacteria)]|uniref:penicillin-insensitive murein endopeptidase n=1 Tax=Paracoccus sp. TaxID=267 RepID=UPI0026E057C2|nr:penicillin-insensitive murein endopeptidase [Paracoccus sp. (in: a-proteobacteria)]MDO5621721.1 penicillin-insensitive murein endopeptidase [Paracoccus sp. (in: a-proteobacteria)]